MHGERENNTEDASSSAAAVVLIYNRWSDVFYNLFFLLIVCGQRPLSEQKKLKDKEEEELILSIQGRIVKGENVEQGSAPWCLLLRKVKSETYLKRWIEENRFQSSFSS